jgi:hypothetical protein
VENSKHPAWSAYSVLRGPAPHLESISLGDAVLQIGTIAAALLALVATDSALASGELAAWFLLRTQVLLSPVK